MSPYSTLFTRENKINNTRFTRIAHYHRVEHIRKHRGTYSYVGQKPLEVKKTKSTNIEECKKKTCPLIRCF